MRLKVLYQDKDVLQASCMEFLHHLWKVSKSPGVKGEYSALVCIVQIVPLYILTKHTQKTSMICHVVMAKQLLPILQCVRDN